VTAYPSTASVPIIVLLYNGPLLCGFNVLIKGLNLQRKNAVGRGASFVILTLVVSHREQDKYIGLNDD